MLADLSTYSLQDFLLFDAAIYRDLFAQLNITRLSLEKIAIGAIPFLLTSLVGLALVAAFPGLSRILTAFMG